MSEEDTPRYQTCKVCGAKDCDCTLSDLVIKQDREIATLTAKLAESEKQLAEWKSTAEQHKENYDIINGNLRQQLAEAQMDAARYRYLRDVADAADWEELSYQCGENQDAMIDEAMARIAE